jgi:aconitate hydratase
VHLKGALKEGVTATDLVLHVTELLRKAKVVGKFVEFHGDGAASLSIPDRATIGNMAPEYGATMGFFPVDEESCKYMLATGRSPELVDTFRSFYQAQGMFGMPRGGDIEYSQLIELDLNDVQPGVAGPKRPQDRINLPEIKERFIDLFQKPVLDGGYNKPLSDMDQSFRTRWTLNGRSAQHLEGGGDQTMESVPVSTDPSGLDTKNNTAAVTEEEMMTNRPTPDRVESGVGRRVLERCRRTGSRRCGDCGHYFVHQHQQPQCHAGGGLAGQESLSSAASACLRM